MAIFTKQEFEAIARSKAGVFGLRDTLSEQRTFSKSTAHTSIFLSHSHKDKSIVEQAKVFFEKLGISIYVDWSDETMPERTSGITASKIKNKIIQNDKFVLLATNDALISKWCNWEVGVGDVYKLQSDKICILPLADSRLTWKGNEYLQIYPRLEESEYTSDYYKVIYPDNKEVSLREWLNK